MLTIFLLAACANKQVWQKPPADYAQAPRPDSLLAPAEEAITQTYGADKSGFNLLE
ncbi:MAG: hypothetical protein IPN53_17525 [Comamonadaceae bacterium]|nr:hypothetical protein [Comamonadaceae bacterium]